MVSNQENVNLTECWRLLGSVDPRIGLTCPCEVCITGFINRCNILIQQMSFSIDDHQITLIPYMINIKENLETRLQSIQNNPEPEQPAPQQEPDEGIINIQPIVNEPIYEDNPDQLLINLMSYINRRYEERLQNAEYNRVLEESVNDYTIVSTEKDLLEEVKCLEIQNCEEGHQCCFCLEDIELGEKIIICDHCGNSFHKGKSGDKECKGIIEYMEKYGNKCPICRAQFESIKSFRIPEPVFKVAECKFLGELKLVSKVLKTKNIKYLKSKKYRKSLKELL